MPFISIYANGYTYARRSKHMHLIILHVYFLVHADTPRYYACMCSRTQHTLAHARTLTELDTRTRTRARARAHTHLRERRGISFKGVKILL